MEELIKIAANELGIKEVAGQGHNPKIVQYAKDAGFQWVNDDETPWCSIFMNWVAKVGGYERSKSAAARSWLNFGNRVEEPEPGDVVIYWRESIGSHKGHVGLFLGYSQDKKRIYTLGGNQGNAVSISAYAANRLLGFRRLRKKIVLPAEVLQEGDKGPKVALLQDALKMAGFNCGTSDGDYGPKTKGAVMELQATNMLLTIDGVFGPKTRAHLQALLDKML